MSTADHLLFPLVIRILPSAPIINNLDGVVFLTIGFRW